MSTWGDSALWAEVFPEELVPKVIELIVTTWARVRGRLPAACQIEDDEAEVSITKWFRIQLITEKAARLLPIIIRREMTVDRIISRSKVASELQTVQEAGRIDLTFAPANTAMEDNYLTFECKRLNVKFDSGFRSLADKYVKQGMLRFFDAHEYGRKQIHGGMVGYVMDGKVDAARIEVSSQIDRRKSDLDLVAPLMQSSKTSLDLVMQSIHKTQSIPLTIHHIFLALP